MGLINMFKGRKADNTNDTAKVDNIKTDSLDRGDSIDHFTKYNEDTDEVKAFSDSTKSLEITRETIDEANDMANTFKYADPRVSKIIAEDAEKIEKFNNEKRDTQDDMLNFYERYVSKVHEHELIAKHDIFSPIDGDREIAVAKVRNQMSGEEKTTLLKILEARKITLERLHKDLV